MTWRELRRFGHDPLEFIEAMSSRHPRGVFQLPWGVWCVNDADLARMVLRHPDFNRGMSHFFTPGLPTRAAQIHLGQSVRETLRARTPEFRTALAEAVAEFPRDSHWPGAGIQLVYRAAAGLLLHPDTEPSVRRLLEQAVDGGLMVRAAHIRQRVRAETLRARLKPALTEHVTRRRAAPCTGEPRDVLDAVLSACPAEVTHREAADLYMLLFRSIVGNVGYSVAWSVLLAGLRHTSASPWPWPADSVVREAARHRPFVWMVGRTAPGPIDIGGVPLPSETNISVCPYLLHHDGSWTSPGTFRPERWAESSGHGTYLPYSAGPFTCAGAGIAHTLTTEAVHALADSARLAVTGADPRPIVTNAAIPRPFTLHRTVRTPTHP